MRFFWVMLIRSTAHPTYDSCLFLYYLKVRLRQYLGRAPRLGQARGPGAAVRSPSIAAVKPRASRTDGRRSKNTPSVF